MFRVGFFVLSYWEVCFVLAFSDGATARYVSCRLFRMELLGGMFRVGF